MPYLLSVHLNFGILTRKEWRALAIYLLLLVMSLFMGTQLLAISTPLAQITVYRLLALAVYPLLFMQVILDNHQVKIIPRSAASRFLLVYFVWWIIGLITGLWAEDLKGWIQVSFLMTIGLGSILALYFWTENDRVWLNLLKGSWLMMTLLVAWGYFEILTNHYLFADMSKLDKYSTFASQPWTRIPITTFANQNDYATMLLAYLSVCICLYLLSSHYLKRIMYLMAYLLASFLIFQSGSRMSLICLLLYSGFLLVSSIRFDDSPKLLMRSGIILACGLGLMILLIPHLQDKLAEIFYIGGPAGGLSGDTKRMNSWRNGLIFLAQTGGLGVGSGNIENWAKLRGFWPTNEITNMHNWWMEILVSNGLVAFVLYIVGYFGLCQRLFQIVKQFRGSLTAQLAYPLFGFLLIFILGSITSANNMLIEWHWVFFGLLIAFVKIVDQEVLRQGNVHQLFQQGSARK